MTAPHADQMIDGYLTRIRDEARDLPSAARDELIEDMRAHIAEARTREPQETDATVLNILDRLGEPNAVVAEARRRPDAPEPTPSDMGVRPGPYRPGLLEIAALVLLIVLWPVGAILLWISPAWNIRDKLIGTLLPPGGYPAIFIVGLLAATTASRTVGGPPCTSSTESAGNIIVQNVCTTPTSPGSLDVIGSVAWVILVVVLWLLPLITVGYLAIRLRWGRHVQSAIA